MIYLKFNQLLCLRRCGRYSQKCGWDHTGVRLPANLLFILESGACTCTVEEKTYHLEVGDILIIPRNTLYAPNTEKGCTYQYFQFYADVDFPDRQQANSEKNTDNYYSGILPQNAEMLNFQEKIPSDHQTRQKLSAAVEELASDSPERYIRMNLHFMSAMMHLSERTRLGTETIADKVKDYIDAHAFDDVSLAGISTHFGYTKQHIIRVFSSKFDISPVAYIERIRLNRAALLLSEGDMGIAEIATVTGFGDANYFSRRFKKHFDASPTDYRAFVRKQILSDTGYRV